MQAAEFLIRRELSRYKSELSGWSARIGRSADLGEALCEAGRRPAAGHLLSPVRHALARPDEQRAALTIETRLTALATDLAVDSPDRIAKARRLLPLCRDWPRARAVLEAKLRQASRLASAVRNGGTTGVGLPQGTNTDITGPVARPEGAADAG